jgi:hypothetical protein
MRAIQTSRCRRGIALLLALAILGAMIGLVLFLTQATLSRVRTQRAAAWREGCVLRAECILARARVALEDGRLKVGQPFKVDGISVESTSSERGVRLEVFVGPAPRRAAPTGKPTGAKGETPRTRQTGRKAKPKLRWRVAVAWVLAKDARTRHWRRLDWEARDQGVWDGHETR